MKPRMVQLEEEETTSPQITQISTDSVNLRQSAKSADKFSFEKSELAILNQRIAPLQKEINQLTSQFCGAKYEIVSQNHDLSAGLYRRIEQEEVSTRNLPSL
jgi:hypothetical protein